MKYIIGFIFGIMVASAVAEEGIKISDAFMIVGGNDKNGAAHRLIVNEDGSVNCREIAKNEK